MHKNPFVPTPGYNPPQPPLPPGPPPQQPPHVDYSGYWAAAAAQGQIQPPAVGTYANQWTAPQPAQPPPRPTPEQSALYANYGYGGNQNYWQQQQRQQTYQPPPPVAQPPPPPPQPGYNPYQPQAPYHHQPYIPQAIPQPPPPPVYQQQPQPLQAQPTQHTFPQQPRQHQNRQQHGSQHAPPTKRQRFDPPRNPQQHFQPHTQFQSTPSGAMPPPMQQQQPNFQSQNQSNAQGRSGGPPGVNQMPLGGRGGGGGARGGRAKPGSMNMNRGGSGGRVGRGGMYGNNNRGGGNAGQNGGNFRNHARGGFGNRDHGNRRGGSFNAGVYSHQQGTSFRGRYNRSGRHDGGSFTARDSNASGTKKEDPKRAMTEFKLVGLEIRGLSWSWGALPLPSVKTESQEGLVSTEPVKLEPEDSVLSVGDSALSVNGVDMTLKTESSDPAPAAPNSEVPGSAPDGATSVDNSLSPPSRIRIYFHSPVTAEDVAPIPHASALPIDASSVSLMSTKRGKRKRADDEDDDGDPDSIHHTEPSADGDAMSATGAASLDGAGRGSLAPSVAETVSEGDWLMAAIGEDENDEDTSNVDDDQLEICDVGESQYGNDVDDPDMRDAEMSFAGISHAVPVENPVVPAGSQHTDAIVSEQGGLSSVTFMPNGDLASTTEVGSANHETVPEPSTEQNASENSISAPVNHVQVADSDLNSFNQKQSTDQLSSSDRQISNDGHHATPLQAVSSFASTVADSELQDTSYSEYSATLVNDEISGIIEGSTQSIPSAEGDQNGDSTSTLLTGRADTQGTSLTSVENTVSPNRLAISYAAASRRIVINAEVVESLRVWRKDRRIEISMTVEKDDEMQLKGIVVEALSENTKTYTPLQLSSDAYKSDPMLPPFLMATSPSKLTLLAHLDSEKPNLEARWVKSGDIQEWLKSTFVRMFWAKGDVADGWEKKIQVFDPDPAPTIRTVLDGWATNGNVGTQTERQRFIRTHLVDTDNILEILLRLVRGERATPFSQSGSSVGATQNSIPGPLLSAIAGSAHGAQQTHVSLAVLALFRMAVEFAKKADGDKGKNEVEDRMGEIVRCLPSHLLHKSLDGMFKEWKADKKGGR